MEQKIVTPVQKGLIISLILIVISLVLYTTGQMENKSLSYIQYVIFVGGIIWSCIYFARQMNANVTFGNVFAHGFKTTAFVTALMAVYTIISIKFIFPEMVDKSIEIARKQMEENKNLSDEQIQQALGITRDFFVPIVMGTVILMNAIFGAIASLIGAAVAKKNPQDPFGKPQM